jgi:CDGSH-type Zn-finger protein
MKIQKKDIPMNPEEKNPAMPEYPDPRRVQKITVSKDGPYVVSGDVPLAVQIITPDEKGYSHHWRKGIVYPMRERYELCRCGKSSTLPFCDRVHDKEGFDGKESASIKPYSEMAETIDGPGLRLTDYMALCASAKFCDRAGGIWNLTRQSDIPAAKKTAVTEAANCPSGRLVVWDKENGTAIEPEFIPSIGLIEYSSGLKGPVWVKGGIPVISADGAPYETRNRVTLCRCGRSSNKPFCDSSHLDENPEQKK